MRTLPCLLLTSCLIAQEGTPSPRLSLDRKTALGADPMESICLTPPGCWDGLILGVATRPRKSTRRGTPGATVEVWDLALLESSRAAAFGLYLRDLRQSLSRAMRLPPPSHGNIELGELMLSDPSSPQKLDLTKVKSMQERYNRLPPNGSPVK